MLDAVKKHFLQRLLSSRASQPSRLNAPTKSLPKRLPKEMDGSPVFSHPCANASISLENYHVLYELQRKHRKSVGIYVSAEGVAVRAPRWVSQQEIDNFLREKSNWLLKKLQEQKTRQRQMQRARIHWVDGGKLNYLGETAVLEIIEKTVEEKGARKSQQQNFFNEYPSVFLSQQHPLILTVCVVKDPEIRQGKKAKAELLSELVQIWMQEQALKVFSQRCQYYAQHIEVSPKRIALTSAKTRWGSANSQKVIRLHWRLMQLPAEVIDYVIVHELAHLKEMNHSPRFWRIVEHILPDYEQRRTLLKQQVLPIWNPFE